MPPKNKFTKQDIISAALDITRADGIDAVTARGVGAALNASPKVIFGLFDSMDALHDEVKNEAFRLYTDFSKREVDSGSYPIYKAVGMAYIRFAAEEKELFKLLFMCDRKGDDVGTNIDIGPIVKILQTSLGLSEAYAKLFHLEMWMFTHGIATTIATSYYSWDKKLIEDIMTDCYNGLKHRFTGEC